MLRRRHRARRHFGVHVVGHVGGGAAGAQVGVVAQHHALALGRHVVGRQALQAQPRRRRCRRAGSRQRGGVAVAAARVGVDASTSSRTRALRRRRSPAAGRAAPRRPACSPTTSSRKSCAGQELLDHHRADFGRGAEGASKCSRVDDVDGDALALVAVLRLDHHRQTDLLGQRPRRRRRRAPAARAAPARRRPAAAPWSGPCPARSTRPRRWCGRLRPPGCGAAWSPSRTAPGCLR